MKKISIVLLLLVSTSAFAFGGGGGGGRTRRFYERHGGVDAIGVHVHGGGNQADIGLCADDEELVGDQCLKKCAEGLERNTDDTCTVCTNGNVYLSYNTNPCGTEISGFTGCKSNKECGEGEFCNLIIGYDCYYPTSGTCQSVTSTGYTDATIEGLGNVRRSGYSYNNPNIWVNYMTWWAAENWCKAQRKSLIDISKFGCYKSNTNTLVTEGSHYDNFCCASGQACNNDPLGGYTDVKYSTTLRALESAFGHENTFFWTASNYNSNDSCQLFIVGTDNYYVFGDSRDNPMGGYYSALCK